jgi:hypothetical protein
MRRFHLDRTEDQTGVSGTGVVAQGVEFDNGKVAMTWIVRDMPTVTVYDSMDWIEVLHGHDGRTVVVWEDP